MLIDQLTLDGELCEASIEQQPRQPEGLAALRRLAEAIGAESCGVYHLAGAQEALRLVPAVDGAASGISALTRAITTRSADNFARAIAASTVPLWWRHGDSLPLRCATAQCWSAEVQPPLATAPGIAFPTTVERGQAGAVVFAGPAIGIDEVQLCDLHASCFALFAEVWRHRARREKQAPVMSKREIECLRLTANGLTSEDIASSLGLSVHTANQYLTNTTHKLNAVNRIHAVAKALRCGMID